MLLEEKLQTPVTDTFDVIVVGAGIAGIAAALSAKRCGKSVLLAERGTLVGGLATAGLVTIYLPLDDGYGRQVSFGLAEELLRLSVAKHNDGGWGTENWLRDSDPAKRTEKDPRFEVQFNPQIFALDAERLLLEEGVKIFFDTRAVGVFKNGEELGGVIFENKSGRFAVACAAAVDASGDADLAKFANLPTALHQKGNILASWYYYLGEKGYTLSQLGHCELSDEQIAAGETIRRLDDLRYSGVSGEDVNAFLANSHASVLRDVMNKKKEQPDYQPVTVATVPQYRMTRKIVGDYTLTYEEMHREFPDSVGLVSDWRRRGPVFEIPLSTLVSSKMKNLFFAGRIISVDDALWDVTRVIPDCAVTGEAAGVAAAKAAEGVCAFEAVQKELKVRGVVLHESEL